jgi:hypothetical protein
MEEYKKNHPQEYKSSSLDRDDEASDGEEAIRRAPMVVMIVALPGWGGSRRRKSQRGGCWGKLQEALRLRTWKGWRRWTLMFLRLT